MNLDCQGKGMPGSEENKMPSQVWMTGHKTEEENETLTVGVGKEFRSE